PFSGQKLFSPIGTNSSEADFLVAGANVKGLTPGVGVVFSGGDVAGSTGIVLIGGDGVLGRGRAPGRTDARGASVVSRALRTHARGASFVGVVFSNPVIRRAVIISGNGALSPTEKDISQGGRLDLVVMDDFLYGEPTELH